ncbi:MAG: hypothetical protein WAO98_04380 [Alphaproteobacteria bacterium]
MWAILDPAQTTPEPTWVTTSKAQIDKARRILTPDFWDSDTPFQQAAYEEIGYPFSVGNVSAQAKRGVYQSNSYRFVKTGLIDRIRSDLGPNLFPKAESDPKQQDLLSIEKVCQQMVEADRVLYGDHRIATQYLDNGGITYDDPTVVWIFSLDILNLKKGERHRGSSEHSDSDLGDEEYIKTLVEAMRAKRANCYMRNSDAPMYHKGPTRHYVTSNLYPTHFSKGRPFKPWEIVHYIAEKHESPLAPKRGTRCFIRAKATPV